MPLQIKKQDIAIFYTLTEQIQSLEKEIKDHCQGEEAKETETTLRAQIQELSKQIQSLQSRQEELKLLPRKEAEYKLFQELELKHKQFSLELDQTISQINNLDSQIQGITFEITCKEARLTLQGNYHQSQIEKHQKEIAVLSEKIKQSDSIIKQHQEKKETCGSTISTYQTLLSHIEAELKVKNIELTALNQAVVSRQTTITNLTYSLTRLQEQLQSEKAKLLTLQNLRPKSDPSNQDLSETDMTQLIADQEREAQKTRLATLIAQIEKSIGDNNNQLTHEKVALTLVTQDQFAKQTPLAKHIRQLTDQQGEYNRIIREERSKISYFNSQISTEQSENKNRSDTINRLNLTIEQHQQEIRRLENLAQKENSTAPIPELQSLLQNTQSKKQAAENIRNKIQLQVNDLAQKKARSDSIVNNLKNQISHLQHCSISHHNWDEDTCAKTLKAYQHEKTLKESSLNILVTKTTQLDFLRFLQDNKTYTQLCQNPHQLLTTLKAECAKLKDSLNSQDLRDQVAQAEIEDMLQAIAFDDSFQNFNEENESQPGSILSETKETQIEGKPHLSVTIYQEKCYQLCGLLDYIDKTVNPPLLSQRIKEILEDTQLDRQECENAKYRLFQEKNLTHYPYQDFKSFQKSRYQKKLREFKDALQPFNIYLNQSREINNFHTNALALINNPELESDDSGTLYAHLADTLQTFTKLIQTRQNQQEDDYEWNNKLKLLATKIKSEQPSLGLKRTGIAIVLSGLALIADILLNQSPIINFQLSNISLFNKMLIINPQLLIPVVLGIALIGTGLGLWQRYKEPKGISKKILATEQAFSQIPMTFFQKPTHNLEGTGPLRMLNPSAPQA